MSASVTVWLTDVFLIVFGQQWRSMAQRNKLYHTLAADKRATRINSFLISVTGFSCDLLARMRSVCALSL